jgi:hypothetical protein
MPKPKYYYKSAGMPDGSRSVVFYRPTNPVSPGAAGGGSDTNLGTYLLETSSPKSPSKTIGRMGVAGEDTDFALVQQRKTMSAVAQLSTSSTPTLQPGDYFEDTFGTTSGGAATANERYVVTDHEYTQQAGDARKQPLTLVIDWDNSARWA